MKHLRISLIALLSFLSACSTVGSFPPPLTPEQAAEKKGFEIAKKVAYAQRYRLSGWNYVDKQNVIIYSSPKHSYLLTLKTRCYDLNSSEVLAFENTAGTIRAGFDRLILPPRNGIKNECYIDEIYLLNKLPSKKNK